MSEISPRNAYIITGPTSGIGRATAFELAKLGTVVLVARNAEKLARLRQEIERAGGRAIPVVCDLSDTRNIPGAVQRILGLQFPIAGVVNNAAVHPRRAAKTSLGWDLTFATNHLGPFVFTEALLPHLSDGTSIVFVVSGSEDPNRRLARAWGYRGSRYISVEASARGEWKSGGARMQAMNAYATSKQCILVAALEFARENPRLRINAVEPGFVPDTALGREGLAWLTLLMKLIFTPFVPFVKNWSTPRLSARTIVRVLTQSTRDTGTYYDDEGDPMLPSLRVRDSKFRADVMAETRGFLRNVRT